MASVDSAAGDRFVIEGGYPVGGDVTPSGNKNEALPLVAAALLAPGSLLIENVPRIRDVTTLIELVRGLGAIRRDRVWVEWRDRPEAPRGILEPVTPERPRVAEHGVEVDRERATC